MKTAIKWICVMFSFFASAIYLEGIMTCGWFAWWMIPTGIVCGIYLVGFFTVMIRKVRRGEW